MRRRSSGWVGWVFPTPLRFKHWDACSLRHYVDTMCSSFGLYELSLCRVPSSKWGEVLRSFLGGVTWKKKLKKCPSALYKGNALMRHLSEHPYFFCNFFRSNLYYKINWLNLIQCILYRFAWIYIGFKDTSMIRSLKM